MSQAPVTKKGGDLEKELEKKIGQISQHQHESEAQKLAKDYNLPFSSLTGVPIDPEALSLLPEAVARQVGMVVVAQNGSSLVVAVLDPKNPLTSAAIDDLKKQYAVSLVVTTQRGLEHALERYQHIKKIEAFELGAIDIRPEDLESFQAKIGTLADLKNQFASVSVTQLLEIIVAGALKIAASDVHFEPEQSGTRLRYRLDGLLHDVTTLDSGHYGKLLNRVKVLSKLKLNIYKTSQDGRFTIRQGSVPIEVRVSILPSEYGETVVMRLLDPRTIDLDLKDLGMRPDILEQMVKQLAKPNGAILTTGPTGSGKTTTLYTFVKHLNTPDTKIITVEDPIEYHIGGISQTQVEPERGYTFASGLRAIVRQDPDIILIGEIRDYETADIALHAALTGHLVFSTIHTNDAAGTIPRLIDLGIKSETIAPAINMAMGQRLVRRLCQNCKTPGRLAPEQLATIQKIVEPIRERFSLPPITTETTFYYPGTCAECSELGYKGRVGVYEIFTISRAMEQLILKAPAISAIQDQAVADGMVTMLQDGYLKMLAGLTSLEEVQRILGEE